MEKYYQMKRLYLNFFWDRFIIEDKKIVKAVPTPLFEALSKLQRPSIKKALVNTDGNEAINPYEMGKQSRKLENFFDGLFSNI